MAAQCDCLSHVAHPLQQGELCCLPPRLAQLPRCAVPCLQEQQGRAFRRGGRAGEGRAWPAAGKVQAAPQLSAAPAYAPPSLAHAHNSGAGRGGRGRQEGQAGMRAERGMILRRMRKSMQLLTSNPGLPARTRAPAHGRAGPQSCDWGSGRDVHRMTPGRAAGDVACGGGGDGTAVRRPRRTKAPSG